MAEEILIKYSKSVYQAKINQLNAYLTQLNAHLQTLETYRDQLGQFWADEDAREYSTTITTSIISVRQAANRVNELQLLYTGIVDQLTKSSTVVDTLLESAKSIAGNMFLDSEA